MRALAVLSIVTACAILQAGCASAPTAPPIGFVAIDQVAAGGASLPASGYVSSGQPNAEALRAVAAAGYVGVVDLRGLNESRGFDEAGTVADLGMRYVSLPVDVPDGISFENAARLDDVLASFEGPVLLHCSSGNRVGALFALRAKADGASDDEAIAVGRGAGLTKLEDMVRGKLAEAN